MKLQFYVWLNKENTQNSVTETFAICICTLNYYVNQNKNKKDEACNMHRGNKKCISILKPSFEGITQFYSL